MKYAILMYNFNSYEPLREIPDTAVNKEIEYIYVTDDSTLKSKNWKIVIDHDLDGLSPFEKCYKVRFNLFKYTNADIIMYIDGSIQILQDPMIYFKQFEESGKDMSICVHPSRCIMMDEYREWVKYRKYDVNQAYKCLCYMQARGYDVKNYKGLYQGGFRIVKNTEKQKQLDKECYDILKELGDPIERIDQTIYSYLLNTKYADMSLLAYDDSCFFSTYLNIQTHNMPFTFTPQPLRPFIKRGYVRNNFIELNVIKSEIKNLRRI